MKKNFIYVFIFLPQGLSSQNCVFNDVMLKHEEKTIHDNQQISCLEGKIYAQTSSGK